MATMWSYVMSHPDISSGNEMFFWSDAVGQYNFSPSKRKSNDINLIESRQLKQLVSSDKQFRVIGQNR